MCSQNCVFLVDRASIHHDTILHNSLSIVKYDRMYGSMVYKRFIVLNVYPRCVLRHCAQGIGTVACRATNAKSAVLMVVMACPSTSAPRATSSIAL